MHAVNALSTPVLFEDFSDVVTRINLVMYLVDVTFFSSPSHLCDVTKVC